MFDGRNYYPSSTNLKYFSTSIYSDGKRKHKQLHHAVWEKANGRPLPSDFVIHHKDHNTYNNDPENLEAIERSAHQAMHMNEKYLDPDFYIKNANHLAKVRVKASEWHRSEIGREVASRASKSGWKKKVKTEVTCQQCLVKFETYFPDRTKFCGHRCSQKFHYLAKTYHEKRVCVVCGSPFECRKSEQTRTCSKECSGKMRRKG